MNFLVKIMNSQYLKIMKILMIVKYHYNFIHNEILTKYHNKICLKIN